jgi:hypothetical protein
MKKRIDHLKKTVRESLPDLTRMSKEKAGVVIFHQDAFAADYQEQEYLLLGMAIKYLGLCKKEIRIIGTNRETLKKK